MKDACGHAQSQLAGQTQQCSSAEGLGTFEDHTLIIKTSQPLLARANGPTRPLVVSPADKGHVADVTS